MARKLKVYQTALGFFNQAVAAPSMKAALEASVSNSNLFRQGAARETDDPEIVASTIANGASFSGVRSARACRSPKTCRLPTGREG